MFWLRLIYTRLYGLLRKNRIEQEMDDEMRFHLLMRTRENIERGMRPDEAEREARRRFSNVGRIKDLARDIKGGGFMETLLQDLRYGARMLMKSPGFTLIAVVTLALGIGANTAIFSVVNATLIRALPYHNPNRMIVLSAVLTGGGRDLMSIEEMREFQARAQSLEDLTGIISQSVNLTGGERPDRVRGAYVTANFFQVFNLKPVTGRTFAPGEDRPGVEKVVVVNEKIWRERLGGDPNLTGKKLILNGEPFSVIGVAPPGFRQPQDADVEVWMGAAAYPGNTAQRDFRFLFGIGHLKPGVDLEQSQAEMNTIANQLALVYPGENTGRGAKVDYLHEIMVGGLRRMLYLLFATVGMILLIACANLANLLLARGLSRQREMAVRAALGANKWRLIRHLLTEASLLSLAGGGLGLLLAQWGLEALQKLPQNFVRGEDVKVDTSVLLFTLAVAVVTDCLFGLAPAIQLSRPELNTMLKEGGRGGGGAKWNRVRSAFVVAQVALSLLLLLGGGLLIRSFDKLLRVDPGFKPENLLTLEYRLPRNKYQRSEAQWNFHRQVIERIRDVPGVKSVSLVRGLPFSGNGGSAGIILPDREVPPKDRAPVVRFDTAMGNYFETMGIPLIKGRLFNEQDRLDTPRVFLINQTMARRFWPDQDPIGKQIKTNEDGVTGAVIGVVGDAKHYWLEEEPQPQMYEPYSQSPGIFATVVVRTTVEPMSLAEPVRQAVWEVDSDQPMWEVRTVESLIDQSLADRRFLMVLMGVFAALALALTVIGLYGVMSYAVSQRTQEIGVRIALGAGARNIHRMVLRQGMTLVSIGVAIGLAASWLLTRLMANLLFGVSATDLMTFGSISSLLTIVALLACWIPARRATKVDPMVALRAE
jgi:putative ABC transport system permease protein